MKAPYDTHFLALIQIVYQKDKVHYFSSKNVISIIIVVEGKPVLQYYLPLNEIIITDQVSML